MVLEYTLQFALKFVLLVSRNLPDEILGDHEAYFTVCHVGFHVDFSSMKAFTFVREVNLDGLRPFDQ
jgi:hypothetical protein